MALRTLGIAAIRSAAQQQTPRAGFKASAGYLPQVRSFTRHGGKPGAAADGAAQKGMCLSRPCLPRWYQRMPARMANAKTEAWGEW